MTARKGKSSRGDSSPTAVSLPTAASVAAVVSVPTAASVPAVACVSLAADFVPAEPRVSFSGISDAPYSSEVAHSSGSNSPKRDLAGAILAGGASRRMNRLTKALLPVEGVPIIRRIADRMAVHCRSVYVAAGTERQAELFVGLGLPLLLDAAAGMGPIAGLHAALAAASEPMLWAAACDMPFASAEAALWMAARLESSAASAAVARVGGRLHPLHAVYRTECRSQAEANMAEGKRSLHDLLGRLDVLVIEEEEFAAAGIDTRFAMNVNTPDDYRQAVAVHSGSGRFGAAP